MFLCRLHQRVCMCMCMCVCHVSQKAGVEMRTKMNDMNSGFQKRLSTSASEAEAAKVRLTHTHTHTRTHCVALCASTSAFLAEAAKVRVPHRHMHTHTQTHTHINALRAVTHTTRYILNTQITVYVGPIALLSASVCMCVCTRVAHQVQMPVCDNARLSLLW